MSPAITITENAVWLNPDKTVNFKALGAHIALVEAKIFPDINVSGNAPDIALPSSGNAESVSRGGNEHYCNGNVNTSFPNISVSENAPNIALPPPSNGGNVGRVKNEHYSGGISNRIFPGTTYGHVSKSVIKPVVHPLSDVESAARAKNEYRVGNIDINSDDKRYYWFGTIKVGTPPKPFIVHFDTGSSDLFLPSTSCNDEFCLGHELWNPVTSSTAKSLGKPPFYLSFGGGGSVEGDIVTDTVSIAGHTATTQTLGAAFKYSTHLGRQIFPADGLLGMSFEKKSRFSARPLIQTLYSEGKIADPVFSFKLASPGGELYIGGANPDRYTGQFTYTPVLNETSWQVNLEKIEVNGKAILSDIKCIIDTGTALVLGNNGKVDAFYKAIGGHLVDGVGEGYHYYSFPCDSFPTINFTFGGATFPIPPSVLNIGRVGVDSSECLSGLVGHDIIDNIFRPYWIVGAVFLQSVYTTFDLGVEGEREPRIGFATLA